VKLKSSQQNTREHLLLFNIT